MKRELSRGVHHYLYKRYLLERLEREILNLFKERGLLPLSAIWRSLTAIYGKYALLLID